MTDEHLDNTIAMLERVHYEVASQYPNFNGEEAQFAAEQEWEAFAANGPDAVNDRYSDLVEERERRRTEGTFVERKTRERAKRMRPEDLFR